MMAPRNKTSGIHPNDPRSGAFLFHREVPLAGFVVRDDLRPAMPAQSADGQDCGAWLVERQAAGVQRPSRRVYPLAEPGLFRAFAELGASDRAVLAFADTWGFLGRAQVLVERAPGPHLGRPGESLRFWAVARQELARLVALWDALAGTHNEGVADEAALGTYVAWAREPVRQVTVNYPDSSFTTVAREHSPAINPDALASWADGELVAPARFAVVEGVNQKLRGQASPAVNPFDERELAIVPHTLLAAMYVVFAREISGRMPAFKKCAACDRYFFPSRSDKKYCTHSCQQKAYEARKKTRGEDSP